MLALNSSSGDTFKERFDGVTNNITDIDENLTNQIAEVNQNSGNDELWQHLLDVVIRKTQASNLRVNNQKQENNENNISDIANIRPDDVNRGFIIGGNWLDNEEIFDSRIKCVDSFGEETGGRTDDKRKNADLFRTAEFILFLGIWIFGISVPIRIIRGISSVLILILSFSFFRVGFVGIVIFRIGGFSGRIFG